MKDMGQQKNFQINRLVQEWSRLQCKVSSSQQWEVLAKVERVTWYAARKLPATEDNRSAGTLKATSQFTIQKTSKQTQKVL